MVCFSSLSHFCTIRCATYSNKKQLLEKLLITQNEKRMKKITTLNRRTAKTFSFSLFLLTLLCFTPASSQALVANWERLDLTPGLSINVPNMIALTYGNGTYAAISYAGGQKNYSPLPMVKTGQKVLLLYHYPMPFPMTSYSWTTNLN